MADKKILLTADGLAELGEELRELREEKRVDIAKKLKEAIEYGDLSENAEYQEARDQQAQVELRIAELDDMLKPGNYELIDEWKKQKKSGALVWNVVTLRDSEWVDTVYALVGSQEADIFNNKISNESPIGKAIISKNIGDTIYVTAPSGKHEYILTAIG